MRYMKTLVAVKKHNMIIRRTLELCFTSQYKVAVLFQAVQHWERTFQLANDATINLPRCMSPKQ